MSTPAISVPNNVAELARSHPDLANHETDSQSKTDRQLRVVATASQGYTAAGAPLLSMAAS